MENHKEGWISSPQPRADDVFLLVNDSPIQGKIIRKAGFHLPSRGAEPLNLQSHGAPLAATETLKSAIARRSPRRRRNLKSAIARRSPRQLLKKYSRIR